MKIWVKGDGSLRTELSVCPERDQRERERTGERASIDGVPSGVPAASNATVCGGALKLRRRRRCCARDEPKTTPSDTR